MGILDRQRQKDPTSLVRPEALGGTSSGTLVRDEVELGDAPDVVKRIELVQNYFLRQMDDGSSKAKKFRRMLAMIAQEGMEELRDAPPEAIEFYFMRAAGLIYWSATGIKIQNIPWPKDFEVPRELSRIDTYMDEEETRELA
jgi:hypothetical protein